MKNILIALSVLVVSSLLIATAAEANDNTAWFLGGVAGGLVLGEVLNNNHHHHHHRRVYEPVYVEPVYQKRCYRGWVQVWDPDMGWISVRKPVCEWVQIQ